MRHVLIALFVLALGSPAFGRELTTRNKTSVYEKADTKSKVLAELEPDVTLNSDEYKDLWFRVTVKLDDATVTGWVNQADVETVMGRSKGQLLEANKRLTEEVTDLRKQVKTLRQELEDLKKTHEKTVDDNALMKQDLLKAQADLKEAKDVIKRLQAEPKRAGAEEK